jgi:hypothetical protein
MFSRIFGNSVLPVIAFTCVSALAIQAQAQTAKKN